MNKAVRLFVSITLGLVAFWLPCFTCNNSASIKSKYGHQLVTSSTLRWKQWSKGGESVSALPREAVRGGGGGGAAVCRAEHHGTLLVGQTADGAASACAVGFFSKMYKKSKFEILLNVDSSARLEWRTYAKFIAVPEGAVAAVDSDSSSSAEHFFVGRLRDGSGAYLPGAIEVQMDTYSFGAMTVFDEGSGAVREVATGEVMVEVEPERYELQINDSYQQSSSKAKVTRQDVVLVKSSLFRFVDEGKDKEARLQKVLSYDYEKSEYYGQVPGTIRALPATVHLSKSGQLHSIQWGLPQSSRQRETIMVGHLLPHQSAVDVSVVGVRVIEEHAYVGTLTAIYPDGDRRARRVDGIWQKRYLNNIRPEYSRVYQIKDSVVVSAAAAAAGGASGSESTTEFWSPPREQHQQRPQHHQPKTVDEMLADQQSHKDKTLSSAVTSAGSGDAAAARSSVKVGLPVLIVLLKTLEYLRLIN